VAAKGRAFQAVVDEAEALIRDNAYKTLPEDRAQHGADACSASPASSPSTASSPR
jgi:hypothetical protein